MPGSVGTPTHWLCRYCMRYQKSAVALRLHTLKSRKSECSKKHIKGRGRANFYDYQHVKEFECTQQTGTGEKCGAMFQNFHNLQSHMSTEHRYSFQTKTCSLDLSDSKNAQQWAKRQEAKLRKDQQERPPTKKQKPSKRRPTALDTSREGKAFKMYNDTLHVIHANVSP